jgi:hypothetical protein
MTEPAGGFFAALAGFVRHLYFIDTFLITLGLFLLALGIFESRQPMLMFGVRAIILGFGFRWCLFTTWLSMGRYLAIVLVVVAFAPTPYFLRAYDYLK